MTDIMVGVGGCERKFLYSTVSTSESSVQSPPLNTQEEKWARCKTATFGSLCILYVKLNIFVNVMYLHVSNFDGFWIIPL